MKAVILVTLGALLGLMLAERESHACDSAMNWSLPLMIEKADRIVIAKAKSQTQVTIEKSLRGSASQALPASTSNCDPHFEPGSRYLVFTQGANYFSDTGAVRLLAANGTRVLAFVDAFMKAKNKKEQDAVRVRTIKQEMLKAHAAYFEYRLLRDALGPYPQGLVTSDLDGKARAILTKATSCEARGKRKWFESASKAAKVGVFEATRDGISLVAQWRGSDVAAPIANPVVGAHYLLVRDSADKTLAAPILLDGDAGSSVLALKEWFAARDKRNRLDVLMSFVRKNRAAVVSASTCQGEAKSLVLDALAALQHQGYRWKAADCRALTGLMRNLGRTGPLRKNIARRCKRLL